MSTGSVVYFQDYFSQTAIENGFTPAEAFFELANAPVVGFKIAARTHKTSLTKENEVTYTLDEHESSSSDTDVRGQEQKEVHIRQMSDCQSHTGGIVWETSYLLAMYLRSKVRPSNLLGKVLEVGAGCGMLGLILAASDITQKVVMTETTEVLPNLKQNMLYNLAPGENGKAAPKIEPQHTNSTCCCSSDKISVRSLRWDKYNKDIRKCQDEGSTDLNPHSFDTIVGTDVIFSTTLVKPLLKTLRIMSNSNTNTYLCVQVRCEDSHALFLKKAPMYGFRVRECTDELKSMEALNWGIDLECKLLHLCLDEEIKTVSNGMSKKKRKHTSNNRGDKKGDKKARSKV